MTLTPHTIGHDASLYAAHRLMREHGCRHLPVMAAGKLMGLLSQRDLYVVENLRDVDPIVVTVSEAMSTEIYCVDQDCSVQRVVTEMAVHKYGAAVVVERADVIGVFTTTDALAVLYGLLTPVAQFKRRHI
ncbi:MAG: hypothetical protein RL701_7128 [Pseudomonadota bacterium]